jgi:hypothetical protein
MRENDHSCTLWQVANFPVLASMLENARACPVDIVHFL